MNFSLADELLYTTVNLQRARGGQIIGSGTGFFWTIRLATEAELTVIVTNKHVIDGCDHVIAVCHLLGTPQGGPSGQFANCIVLAGDNMIPHPDPSIDLCAIFFGPVLNEALRADTPLFIKTTAADSVPDEAQWNEFDSIEDIVMVGYPRGIYDEFNNLPIVRRGITATPLGKCYNGRDEFMVDIACFPGSSGSPVFLMQRQWFDRKNNTNVMAGQRFFLLGVLYSGPLITNEGTVILSQQPKVEVAAMMHLGQVIRSSALLTLEEEVLRRTGEKRAKQTENAVTAG